jgi:hypothetical protein
MKSWLICVVIWMFIVIVIWLVIVVDSCFVIWAVILRHRLTLIVKLSSKLSFGVEILVVTWVFSWVIITVCNLLLSIGSGVQSPGVVIWVIIVVVI